MMSQLALFYDQYNNADANLSSHLFCQTFCFSVTHYEIKNIIILT